jgi:hypothetical protein
MPLLTLEVEPEDFTIHREKSGLPGLPLVVPFGLSVKLTCRTTIGARNKLK